MSAPEEILNLMVARQLRDARKSQGVSQEELANRLGVSRQQVIQIESGRNSPSFLTIVKYLKALGLYAALQIMDEAEWQKFKTEADDSGHVNFN